MQEAKKREAADQSREREVKERQSEATTKDQLKDVERGEKVSQGTTTEESVPSPDGQPADRNEHDSADGRDKGGPM